MRSKRPKALLVGAVIAALAAFVLIPTAAMASTLYVSPAAPSAPYNNCAHPAYDSIQAAIKGPGTTLHVCPGTYAEQLQIERPISITAPEGGVTVKLPSVPQDSTTPCDTAIQPPYQPNQDEISICGVEKVSISDLKVEALWPEGTCYDSLYGIFISGGATLKATNVTVDGAGASPINGCQGGVSIEVGTARTEPNGLGFATLKEDTISGYQKNGITAEGEGSSISVTSTTVTGAGATPAIAQNGIQVSYGASGTIKSSAISGNECDVAVCGSNSLTETQSAGVLFYGAANGSSVSNSTIDGNDMGVYAESSQESEPTSSQILVSSNTLENDRYESVLISQGWVTVKNDSMIKGNVGIQLLQYAGQPYGPKGTGTGDHVGGMTKWAVQGLSDNELSDMFGTFEISKSSISGNPGPTVASSVNSNNPAKLKIFTNKDT